MVSAHIRSASIILLLLLTIGESGYGADAGRERRLVEEIDANLFDGELIRLESGDLKFAAVELRPEAD